MQNISTDMSYTEFLATLVALAAASVSPLAFVVAATGFMSMHLLGLVAILPAVLIWLAIAAVSRLSGWHNLAFAIRLSILAGIPSVIAMEVVRMIGFRVFHGMPGSLPMLLGVLLTNHFMEGPSWWTDVVGWADHFWNGIGFVFIYFIIFGRQRWWVAIPYVLGIATIFMLSPVMNILGAGIFGQDFAPVAFPLTVYAAHLVYGIVFGYIGQKSASTPKNIISRLLCS